MPYIVLDGIYRGAEWSAVVAPTGYLSKRDGSGIERDGTPSPEMGPVKYAYEFATRRAAEKVAGKLVDAKIIDVTPTTL